MSYTNSDIQKFRRTVLNYYRRHGRHSLPWRKTVNPYRILVSEIMLQQTQVERVIPKYKGFLKKFPTVSTLAGAPLSAVLKEWQGLGYNRRAKMLHQAAKEIVIHRNNIFPRTYEDILSLSGVGPYTASAVRVFAFNEPEALIETNVRSVFIHHFFPKKKKVNDASLIRLVTLTVDGRNPREWYSALMDYGTHIKKSIPNPSRKSAHYARQKPFKGSDREVRGAIVRELSKKNQSIRALQKLGFSNEKVYQQIQALLREGLVVRMSSSSFSLPR